MRQTPKPKSQSPSSAQSEPGFVPRPLVGYAAAFTIMLIWSGWLVTSRSGVQSQLTIWDIMAFRFGIASIIALPFVLYVKPWRGMTMTQIVATSIVLGIPYTTILFSAFDLAPAAHGAVFMNGILPALTAMLAFVIYRERPTQQQIIGGILIIVGASLAAFGTVGFDFAVTWRGDVMFIISGSFFAVYMMLNRVWHLTTTQIWLCGSIINGIIFMPAWFWLLPSGIEQTSTNQLILQMSYQGIIPNIIGLVLVAVTVRNVGPAISAAMMSGVPALSSFLGFVILGEELSWIGIVSLCILTPGIIIASLPARKKQIADT